MRIGLSLASALAHLHQLRLVHRDIKPSNIIFVGGVPKLADIGLVADLGEARSFVGTQGFIPPEGPGTSQADLYSLGKVLYELSTGKDRHDFPELPENLRALPDQDALIELNAVLVRACASDPRQRYQTAEELHADLALLQRGESVQAKRVTQRRLGLARKVAFTSAGLALLATAGWFLATRFNAHRVERSDTAAKSRIDTRGTTSQEAFNAHQLGRFFFNKLSGDNPLKAIGYFEQAIRLDTNYVDAYAGLADCYIWNPPQSDYTASKLKLPLLAERLLQLDETRPQGHTIRAIHSWWFDWIPGVAEKELRHAIELDATYAVAHQYLGLWLTCVGRFDEAHAPLKRAAYLEPTSTHFRLAMGFPFLASGRVDEAIAEFNKARELEREFPSAHGWLAAAFEIKGDFATAISHWEKCDLLRNGDSAKITKSYEALRQAAAQSGAHGYWQARLAGWQALNEPAQVQLAQGYAHLGDKRRAIECLQRAAVETPADLAVLRLKFGTLWEALREEREFVELVRKVGLER